MSIHDETKRLIRERAERIGRLATELLLYSDAGRDAAEALKWSWLVLRRPRSYLERFRGCELRIDADALESFIWSHQEKLFGAGRYRLLEPERDLLDLHAAEVDRLERLGDPARLPASQPRSPFSPAGLLTEGVTR